MAPPPPPHVRPPPLPPAPGARRTKDTSSLTLSIERLHRSQRKKGMHQHQHSKSAFSTPNDSPNPPGTCEGVNPYLKLVDADAEEKSPAMASVNVMSSGLSGLPPPPLSPQNSNGHLLPMHLHDSIPRATSGQRRGSLHHYRARTGSLPFYETPTTLSLKRKGKSKTLTSSSTTKPRVQLVIISLIDILPPAHIEDFDCLYLMFEFVDTDLSQRIHSPQHFEKLHA